MGLLGAMAAAASRGEARPVSQAKAGSKPQPYEPTILSIRKHAAPEWYDDAKFGMFIDYGLYSIAGYAPKREKGAMYPDWYLYRMYEDPEFMAYHRKTWGADFERDDFIPKFTAESFDAEALAQIAEDAGMRYVVPFCKHHDGFCLWPSSYTKRNALAMGPKRDLIGPLRTACSKRALKFGFYFSIEEWEYPILQGGRTMMRLWDASKGAPRVVAFDEAAMKGRITGKVPVKDFFGDYIIPQAKEFIDRYDPDLLWMDGEWTTDVNETRAPEIVSYLYNHAARRKEVAANDRLGENTRFSVGDFYSSEYGSHDNTQTQLMHKWEECRGVSQSFGFNWQDTEKNVISLQALIETLAGVVSKGGNLLLIVNLDGKGAMPEYIRSRLREIGQWLKVNGEAIYGTVPWMVASQGETLHFTQSKDRRYMYAVHRGWPQGEVVIDELFLDRAAKIRMLGVDQNLRWRQVQVAEGYGKGAKVRIEVPEAMKSAVAMPESVAFRIELTA
jgi:alpha-L-fucosidase